MRSSCWGTCHGLSHCIPLTYHENAELHNYISCSVLIIVVVYIEYRAYKVYVCIYVHCISIYVFIPYHMYTASTKIKYLTKQYVYSLCSVIDMILNTKWKQYTICYNTSILRYIWHIRPNKNIHCIYYVKYITFNTLYSEQYEKYKTCNVSYNCLMYHTHNIF